MEKILVLVLSLLLVFSLGVCMKDYATKEDLEEQIESSFDWVEEELKDISKQCSRLEKEKSVNYIDNRIDYESIGAFFINISHYSSGTITYNLIVYYEDNSSISIRYETYEDLILVYNYILYLDK